jgi:D-beta-D-heptose 7-phosphate kinase/D-beta-D-heptose 1-phosphate adenosyltransferase
MPDSLSLEACACLSCRGFAGTSVLVIGDLMLDRYVLGEATRLSPEAPVPVVYVKKRWSTPGGAGNVARNIAGLRARASVAGVVGSDPSGRKLIESLKGRRIDTSGVFADPGRPTTSKTRIICGSQQIVRFDHEADLEIGTDLADRLLSHVLQYLVAGLGAIILSDYAKGVLTRPVVSSIIAEAKSRNIPVFVDPKHVDFTRYSGATWVTPNLREFIAAARALGIPTTDLEKAACELRSMVSCEKLLITKGAEGMTLVDGENSWTPFPAVAEQVFDVSGAGDTVIATLATATAGGVSLHEAISLANVAASLVIQKVGTAPVRWHELAPRAATPLCADLYTRLRKDHRSRLRSTRQ